MSPPPTASLSQHTKIVHNFVIQHSLFSLSSPSVFSIDFRISFCLAMVLRNNGRKLSHSQWQKTLIWGSQLKPLCRRRIGSNELQLQEAQALHLQEEKEASWSRRFCQTAFEDEAPFENKQAYSKFELDAIRGGAWSKCMCSCSDTWGFGEHPHGGIQNCTMCKAWLVGWRGSSCMLLRRKKEGHVVYCMHCERGLLHEL